MVNIHLIITLFAGLLYYGEACRCDTGDEIKLFCRAEFAITAYVNSSQVVNDERIFTVHALRDLKGYSLYGVQKVFTPTEGSLCGVSLNTQTYYLLAGTYTDDKRLHLGLCNVAREMTILELVHYRPPDCK
ncbi:metalloproteinase inhibitor 3-like [Dreissena polymorpha]|uniref:NTR domain-containing protein n=1 Tax=Dreissena polymorpha TaxID=45954 RepID=A0A9D4S4F8_DREPO|nr:metalloproteinase inhibitor 3-like [Dreissena polymorpha]KAH3890235.1 hypothetical protein DPMN_014308 [Dreissena polymorpha]